MKDEFVARVGVWGQRHYNYLKKKSPTVINAMRMKGTLEQYLSFIARQEARQFSAVYLNCRYANTLLRVPA